MRPPCISLLTPSRPFATRFDSACARSMDLQTIVDEPLRSAFLQRATSSHAAVSVSQSTLPSSTRDLRRTWRTFQGNGRAQDFAILADCRNGDNSSIRKVANHCLAGLEITLNLRGIPVSCMTDIPDCGAVVSAPEERRVTEGFLLAQHVAEPRPVPVAPPPPSARCGCVRQ